MRSIIPTGMVAQRSTRHWNCCYVCLFIVTLFLVTTPKADATASDILKLFGLKNSFTHAKDHLPSWFQLDNPPCNWTGIVCSGNVVTTIDLASIPLDISIPSIIWQFSSMIRLNLSGCGLSGELPDALGGVPALQYLDLSYNQLSGALPASLYQLTNLKELNLASNLLSSSVSPAIGQLKRLSKLSLSTNKLFSRLPVEIGMLGELELLDLSRNMFYGSMPLGNLTKLLYLDASQNSFSAESLTGIGSLVNLLTLDLSSNIMEGPIPTEIGKLVNLHKIWLGHNGFTGSIPEEIFGLKVLSVLSLPNCKLTGSIPVEIANLGLLENIDISENSFTGELPSEIGELHHLEFLIALHSGLSGPIPEELGRCKRLKILDLSFNSFTGPLPDTLAGLSSISSFAVDENLLSGPIPSWIGSWKMVSSIKLSVNMFTGSVPALPLPLLTVFSADANNLSGKIPSEICQAEALNSLSLARNNLTGSLKETFKGCLKLTDLILSGNSLAGEIPGYFADLPLVTLSLSSNNFTGELPEELWQSSTLLEVTLSDNQLTGRISDLVSRLSGLMRLQLDNNRFEGPIPRSIGMLKNLTNLSLSGNRLTGELPLELFNCTSLVALDISSNKLSGRIPPDISRLTMLENLVLSDNWFVGSIPDGICSGFQRVTHPDSEFDQHYGIIDLSYNQLTGAIPASISNCVVLKDLQLQGNMLTGGIPHELAELRNLTFLDLSYNLLTGPAIPWNKPMVSMQSLRLSNNRLGGAISDDIDSILPNLVMLNLSRNRLASHLPDSMFSIDKLIYVDVSQNLLSGPIPLGGLCFSQASFLQKFNASNNRLSGGLEGCIGNQTSLTEFDVHSNLITGALPPSVANLAALTYLDVSNNGFSGVIPCGICELAGLSFAGFSGNKFEGFSSGCSLANSACDHMGSDYRPSGASKPVVIWPIVLCILAVSLLVLFAVLRWRRLQNRSVLVFKSRANAVAATESASSAELLWKRPKEPLSINLATFEHPLLRVTADDILKATGNFSKAHIIGDGGFGTVYKAALPQGKVVAIKRLHGGRQFEGGREFVAEMETIGKVKHPNLVPLLGYCVFRSERFLIYEYMEHGSLESWLRNRADAVEALQWPVRLKICLGSARGLAFLHHGVVPHIIHRDMKSSNILLDENFEPRVSDFGLARLISAFETHVTTDIAGTLGYIPPEYGLTMKSTTKGDIYSFGVVMLELLTGRPPTGQEDGEGGGHLVGWVRWMTVRGRRADVFDPCLPESGPWRAQMERVLAVANGCTAEEPWRRPTMLEVARQLEETKVMTEVCVARLV